MGLLTPLAVRIGALSFMPKLLPQITATDKALQKVTKGRVTVLRIAGLPNLTLTVRGRKSGTPRSTPLLAVPRGDSWLIAGSNFGGPKPPVWVLNIRSAEQVTVVFNGRELTAVPHELTGDERDVAWTHMLKTWPNYAKYAERTDRVIPVFSLEPIG